MKKILAFILMAVILVCPVFASGEAAETAEVTSHSHEFVIVENNAATCVDGGSVDMACAICGISYSYEVSATGVHTYVESVKDATCTDAGVITYVCSVCGDTYTEILDIVDHTPSADEPTCTEAVTCTVCGETLEKAVGHSYTYQYDAVIAEDGSYDSFGTWVCDVCGDVLDATEGNAVYYYGLLDGDDASEAGAETEIADPNTGLWTMIEIIAAVVIVVEMAILMISFGKKKKA